MVRDNGGEVGGGWGRVAAAVGAALLFALATPWVLRPWFLEADTFPTEQGSARLMTDADLYLNVWILAWIAHAAVTNPTQLFNGNIFHPSPNTIAGSENMLAHLPVTVPVLALTHNALLVLKAMALESFVLTGLATYLLVYHHTRDAAAALVAGAAFTFNPWRAQVLPQPQYLGAQYLPFALLGVDCWLAGRRRRALLGVAAAVMLQLLACVYIGYFTVLVVPIYAAARLLTSGTPRPLHAAVGLVAAFLLGVLLTVPAALPYLAARAEGIIPVHDLGLVRAFSWAPWITLSPALVDKVGPMSLAIVCADLLLRLGARLLGRRVSIARVEIAVWALVAAGVFFTAGPYLDVPDVITLPSPYLLFYHYLPGFSSIRAPIRFIIVVAVGLAVLSGFALWRWLQRIPHPARVVVALALALGCVATAAPRPPAVMPANLGARAPLLYRWLANDPKPGAVLEIPTWAVAGDIAGNLRSGRYMVASTIHWRPLLNGYTAYPPETAAFYAAAARRLPDPRALAVLVDSVDVRWIVVHRTELWGIDRQRWSSTSNEGLRLEGRFGWDELYEVTRPPQRPWRGQLLERARRPQPTTLEGTPTAPLAAECRRARLAPSPPATMHPAVGVFQVLVRFENVSPCTWPALDVRPEGLVGLTYRWVSPTGDVAAPGPFTRLIGDVRPGQAIDETMLLYPPGAPLGTWRLDVMLQQQGSDEPIAVASANVELQAWQPRR